MPLKFAVVREDPSLELALSDRAAGEGRSGASLVVASGGCSALSLLAERPSRRFAAFDLNPDQLAHVAAKRRAAIAGDRAALGVGFGDGTSGLHQAGEFEKLFRMLRAFLEDHVTGREGLRAFFDETTAARSARLGAWTASRYWPTAFTLAFHEDYLVAMFGPDAIQHAPRGSYPGYFRRVFERGLGAEDAARNPFLQHVFAGGYRDEDAPAFVRATRLPELELTLGTLEAVPDLGRFDVVSLSNIFDWSSASVVTDWAALLRARLPEGAYVLVRQLNNPTDLGGYFGEGFVPEDALASALHARDRSLFYERVRVFRRAGG